MDRFVRWTMAHDVFHKRGNLINWISAFALWMLLEIWRRAWLLAFIPWRILYEVLDNFVGTSSTSLPPYSLTNLHLQNLPLGDRKKALKDAVDFWWGSSTTDVSVVGLRSLATFVHQSVAEVYLHTVLGRSKHELDLSTRSPLLGARCLDINCGVGNLCEKMALSGASVVGISLDETAVTIARSHWKRVSPNAEKPNYTHSSAADFARSNPEKFDVVVCSELLDHTENMAEIVASCCQMVRKDGCIVFTVPNRTWTALIVEITGFEHLLAIVPYGTHRWRHYKKPSEITSITRRYGYEVRDKFGMIPVGVSQRSSRWLKSSFEGLWFLLVVQKTIED